MDNVIQRINIVEAVQDIHTTALTQKQTVIEVQASHSTDAPQKDRTSLAHVQHTGCSFLAFKCNRRRKLQDSGPRLVPTRAVAAVPLQPNDQYTYYIGFPATAN